MGLFPTLVARTLVTVGSIALITTASVAGVQAAPKSKSPSYVAAASGIVGISQSIQVSAPRYANRTVGVNVSGAGTSVPLSIALDSSGNGSAAWVPPASGTWQAQGTGPFAIATGSTFFVSAVPTATTLYAPNQAQAGVATDLVATVQATSGALLPLGSITFSNQYGGTIGSAQLVAGGNGMSTATLSWTPPSIGYYPIVATYFPAAGAGGFANTGASSDVDTVQVVQGQPAMALRLPSAYRLGTPTTLTALITNSNLVGGAAFLSNANGTITNIGGSVAASGGTAQASWTPTTLGNQIISASFSATNSYVSAVAQQIVTVLPAYVRDPISVAPSGQGQWPLTATIPLRANARVAVAASAQSGSPLSMSTSGNCVMIATTLIATATPGTCVLTVTSPGASDWSANTATYTFEVSAPAKKK